MVTTLKNVSAAPSIGVWGDLTTASATQLYDLGRTITIKNDANSTVTEYIYLYATTGLTQYQPYQIVYGSTAGQEIGAGAPATLAAPGRQVVIPQMAVTTGYYFWGVISGDCTSLVPAVTYAVGDYLKLTNACTTLIVDGTSGSTSRSVNSCAISKTAGSTATGVAVWLLGISAVI